MTKAWLVFAALLNAVFLARAADPWDSPFARDTAQILSAARDVKAMEGADAIVLLFEQKHAIDSAGRTTTTLRKVYRVLTQDGVDDWSTVEQEYAAWHERKPELRARVIGADGVVRVLDPKTITEAPAVEFDSKVFSDRRVLRAPLPAVAAGCVVELELTIRETAPLFDAGVTRRIRLWDAAEIRRAHLLIESPSVVPLRVIARLLPDSAARRTESKNVVRYEYDWGPILPPKDTEFSTPFDVPARPVVEYSTGRSWQELATRYSAVVDGRIGTVAGGSPGAGETPRQIAARLTGALHKRVRYTGLELGDAALIPATPAEVDSRQYGDCKDKATALVAALRAAGLKASVALLLTGTGLDVNPELPGMGNFDHAIVYVDGPEPLWIDATAQYTRVGDLPIQDQGRLALIADPKTTGLVRIPESKAADNRTVHTVEIRLADYGKARISETIEATGQAETELRERHSGEPAKIKEAVEAQAKQVYLVKSVGEVKAMAADDFSQPFRLSVSMEGADRGITEEDEAGAGLFSHFLFSDLPYLVMPERDQAEPPKPRTQDLVLFQPYVEEYRYRVYYPAFLKPKPLPKDQETRIGPGVFRRAYRSDPSGYIEAVYHYETGPRRWTPADLTAARESLRDIYNVLPEMILFSSATSEALALGKVGEALRIARDYAAANPKSASAQARLSRVLIAAGAGDAAVATARAATALDDKSTQAWQALGWAYQHDSFGRRFGGNWNPAEVEKAYRKAIDAAPENIVPQLDLAIVFEHNQVGDRYGKGARLSDAVDAYRAILKKGANVAVQQNLAIALVRGGRNEEAAAELKKMAQDGVSVMLSAITDARLYGADRAILNLQSRAVDPKARFNLLVNAAITLGQMRDYELAGELLRAARRIGASPEVDSRLAALSKLKRSDQPRFGPDDPRSVVESVYAEILTPEPNLERIKELVTKRDRDAVAASATTNEVRRTMAGIRGKLRSVGMSLEAIADFAAGGIEFLQKGDDSFGFSVSGLNAGAGAMPTMFVVKEDGKYRLLASSDSLENVGKLVLDLIQANQLDLARKWLDLTTEVVKVGVYGVQGPAGQLMWSGLPANARTANMARIVAANYIGMYSVSDEAIAILKKARPSAANSVDRGQIDLALCQSYAKAERWTDLLASAKDLTATYAMADKSFDFVVKARTGLKQWAELEQDARAELKKTPESLIALRAAALAHLRAGAPAKATPYIEQLSKLMIAGTTERNLQAWHSLLVGAPSSTLVDELAKEKDDDLKPDPHYLLGLLHASLKNPEEAQHQLAGALDIEEWTLLDARPFVLQGLIQQQYGNTDSARSAFAEARKRAPTTDDAEWALRLIPKDPQ